MLWFYENLEVVVGGIFATGMAMHFLARWLGRRDYLELRTAYENAVREARDSHGESSAVVRRIELHRAFMHSQLPGWFEGFGRCLGRWLKVCAVFTLVAYFLKGPIVRGEEEAAMRRARSTATERSPRTRHAKSGTTQR